MKIWDANPGFEFVAERDLPDMHSWFLDGGHSTPPITPLCAWLWSRYCSHGLKYACSELSVPACKGWEIRTLEGRIYCALDIVRDPVEIAARRSKFDQKMAVWLADFDSLWEKFKKELLKIYEHLKRVDVNNASNLELARHNVKLIQAYMRMWEVHFLGLYASFSGWSLLESFTKERFNIDDQNTRFQEMLRGFDNKVYQMDKRLGELQTLAEEMGLAEIFKKNVPQTIAEKLGESAKGKKWLSEFMKFMKTDEIGGWRMRRFIDFTEPYWLEDPSIPLSLIKDNMARGISFDLGAKRNKFAAQRKAAVAAFLAEIPSFERESFRRLVDLAGKVSPYNEEHNLYCELTLQAIMRRGYLAIGKNLARKGTIDRPEDIFMLNPEEIESVIMVPEAHDLRWITRRRKSEWAGWHKIPRLTPCLTNRSSLEEAIKLDILPSGDTVAIKAIFGEISAPSPGIEADLRGTCGSSGEAEGTACVVFTYDDLGKVNSGDILVCRAANPAWTPVFGKISGVITDTGGTLCHAAIIGREYGLPAIVNTRWGTHLIKPGQKVKILANEGAVFILDG